MNNHDITELQPNGVVKIIDDNLKEESDILKNLVEKVFDSNVKVKEKYLDTLRDNENKLNNVITSTDAAQNAMRNTSKRQEQEWLSAFGKSQERIFDINSRYRFYLINNIKESYKIDSFVNDIESITNQLIENAEDLNRISIDVYHQNTDKKKDLLEHMSELSLSSLSHLYIELDQVKQPLTISLEDLNSELKLLFEKARLLIANNQTFQPDWIKYLLQVNQEDDDHQLSTYNSLKRLVQTQTEFYHKEKEQQLEIEKEKHLQLIESQSVKYIELEATIKEKILEKSYYQNQNKDTSMIDRDIHQLQKQKSRLMLSKIESDIEKRAWKETKKQIKLTQRLYDGFTEQSYEWTKDFNLKSFELTKSLSEDLLSTAKTHNNDLYQMIIEILNLVKSMIARMSYHQETLINEVRYVSLQKVDFQAAYERYLNQMAELVSNYRKQLKNALDVLVEESKYIRLFSQKQMLILNYHIERFDLIKKEIAAAIDKTSKDVSAKDLIAIEGLRRKEKLLSSIIENEILIENARNEYNIQVEKAQTFYQHDQSINEVQNFRLDSSVDVTKAMIKALIQRQANFAKQQLLFTEEEYISRLRHIETLYNQEIAYLKDQIELYKTPYLEQIEKKSNEHTIRLDEIRKRMNIFVQPKYVNKLKEEEAQEIRSFEKIQIQINTDMALDDTIVKYTNQMNETLKQKEQALEDALNIRNKSLETFNELKLDSESKLEAFEKTIELPKQLPIFDRETVDLSKQRLESALDYAQKLLNEKLEKPIKYLEELTKEYERYQNETDRVIIEANPNMVNINALLETFTRNLNQIHREIEIQNEKIIHLISQQNQIQNKPIQLDKKRIKYYKNQKSQLEKYVSKLKMKLLNNVQSKIIEINQKLELIDKLIDENNHLKLNLKQITGLYTKQTKNLQQAHRKMLKQYKQKVQHEIISQNE